MTLQQRIEAALTADADWSVTPWTETTLKLFDPIPVRARHMGHVVSPFRRAAVAVEAILGRLSATGYGTGMTIEDVEEALIGALSRVEDCYPELLPSTINYDTLLVDKGTRFVTIRVTCLGGPA